MSVTVRIVDRVEGRAVSRTVENESVALALLLSLFARPQFDPWGELYPLGPSLPETVSVSVTVYGNGDSLVSVDRAPRDTAPEGEELLPS